MRCNPDNNRCRAGKIIGGIILGIGAAFLFGLVIMLLWNELMPHLFEVRLITYWQAFGLALLGRLLFGGVGGGGSNGSKLRDRRSPHRSTPFTDKMKDWEYYDKWWSEKGEKSFRDYAEKVQKPEVVDAEEVGSK